MYYMYNYSKTAFTFFFLIFTLQHVEETVSEKHFLPFKRYFEKYNSMLFFIIFFYPFKR